MCYFLAVAVPAIEVKRIADAFSRGFQIHPTANQSLLAAIPPNYATRLVTSGGCSCDLYSPRREAETGDRSAQLRAKFEKRDWSKAKVERAIAQAGASQPLPAAPCGLRGDVIERLKAIGSGTTGIAIVVNWYDGDVEVEQLSLVETQRCTITELPARASMLDVGEVLVIRD